MSNFTWFHNVFYAICILKTFNSHISVAFCSFFEIGTDSISCIWEWVKVAYHKAWLIVSLSVYPFILQVQGYSGVILLQHLVHQLAQEAEPFLEGVELSQEAGLELAPLVLVPLSSHHQVFSSLSTMDI